MVFLWIPWFFSGKLGEVPCIWRPGWWFARGRPSSSIKAAVDMVALYTRRGDLRGQAGEMAEKKHILVYVNLGHIYIYVYIYTVYIYIYIYILHYIYSHRKNSGNTKYVLDGHWCMEIDANLLKTHAKRWDLPKLAIPLFKVMSLYFSNIHISDTQIGRWFLWIIYIYINVAVSCKQYPLSLPYIIIVQTCGKRWDLPKFVDVLSVNLGFSRLLIYRV